MKSYDVLVVGGSIAGSIVGKYTAISGFNTLIIESAKTPREKACSGIQFRYFEKLIGERIPYEKLCSNELNQLYIEFPGKKSYKIPFKMLNFTRIVFDDWLNKVAISAGAEFRDTVLFLNYREQGGRYIVRIKQRGRKEEEIKCTYLIAADGLMSKIRRKITPEHFLEKPFAPTMNYYIKAESDGDLDPNTLYQFWNLDFSNTMFAWMYKKDDLWVVGTGHTDNFIQRCDALLDYVNNNFNLKGEILKKESFASTLDLMNPNHVFLGRKNLLFLGDAAGLVDMYRGLGMDAAALSGRLAAKALKKAKEKGCPAIEYYQKYMKKIVKNIRKNTSNNIIKYKTNEELLTALKKKFLKTGLATFFASLLNKFLPANKLILLPI
jgi:flavin-dependent dehydrogenase